MNDGAPPAVFSLDTPPGASAIAGVTLSGDIDLALKTLGIAPVRVGEAKLRDLAGVDRGVVARWSERSATLMPHAGAMIVRDLLAALRHAGMRERSRADDPRASHPEACDLFEALALDALPFMTSPRAVDLLLAQPGRWRSWDARAHPIEAVRSMSAVLNRLRTPPTVVALGASNIGKSTLLNALARRTVSIVHDEPGVTRDHVGVTLDLDAVAVRWLDTPGVRDASDPVERDAIDLAASAAAGADLVVLCADHASGWVEPPPGVPTLRVGVRADLGAIPGAAISVSAVRAKGLDDLTLRIRRQLIPDDALSWDGPWLFDERLLATGGSEGGPPAT